MIREPHYPRHTKEEIKALILGLDFGTHAWVRDGGEINLFLGCQNDCVYCYARNIAYRMKRIDDYFQWVFQCINLDVLNAKIPIHKKESAKYDYMFQSTSDVQSPRQAGCITIDYETPALQKLKEIVEKGHRVLITTKPRLAQIQKVCDILYPYRNQVTFRFTITSVDSRRLQIFERKASSFEERLGSIRYAYARGFNTSVSCEPLIDRSPEGVYNAVAPYLSPFDAKQDIGSFWVGLMKTKYMPHSYIRALNLEGPIETIHQQNKIFNVVNWFYKMNDKPNVRYKESVLGLLLKNDIIVSAKSSANFPNK